MKKIFKCAISTESKLESYKIPNTDLYEYKTISDCFGEFLIPNYCMVKRVLIHQTNDKMECILKDIEYQISNNIVFFKIEKGTEFIGDVNFPVDIVTDYIT